jgi:hypothetical protein
VAITITMSDDTLPIPPDPQFFDWSDKLPPTDDSMVACQQWQDYVDRARELGYEYMDAVEFGDLTPVFEVIDTCIYLASTHLHIPPTILTLDRFTLYSLRDHYQMPVVCIFGSQSQFNSETASSHKFGRAPFN